MGNLLAYFVVNLRANFVWCRPAFGHGLLPAGLHRQSLTLLLSPRFASFMRNLFAHSVLHQLAYFIGLRPAFGPWFLPAVLHRQLLALLPWNLFTHLLASAALYWNVVAYCVSLAAIRFLLRACPRLDGSFTPRCTFLFFSFFTGIILFSTFFSIFLLLLHLNINRFSIHH